ncbi:MAG: Fur family transcriptional regulator [Planctomycetota bacterium]|jgi:Fur family ferric uptake transcriptional regulator
MRNKAIDILQAAKLRQTEPRIAIISAMMTSEHPLTQEQIAEQIGTAAPNKTTIYRNLMHLAEKNVVHEAYIEERSQYFELAHQCGKVQCHPHFTCSRCHETSCLTGASAPLVTLPSGFSMQRQQIRIEGVCDKCGQTG